MLPNRANTDIRSLGWSPKLFLALAISAAASLYILWFLSFPILDGFRDANGEPMSRVQFLSRVLLPELWLSEFTAGGRMPTGIGDRLPILAGVVLWYAIGYVVGRGLVVRALPNSRFTKIEQVALAILAGMSLLSTLTLLIGLARGSASRWPILAGVTSLVVAAFWMNRKSRVATELHLTTPWLGEGIAPSGVFGQLAGRLVVALTLALAGIYLLGMSMPPYEFDVVEYHLQSAKEFYQQGYIGFNDHNIYVNMPLGLEMHSLAAMSLVNGDDGWWLGGLIGKVVIGGHALLAAGLIGGYCARYGGTWVGWCAAGIWLAVPGNAHVSCSGLVDTALGAYLLAGVIVLTEWWRAKRIADGNWGGTRPKQTTVGNGVEAESSDRPNGAALVTTCALVFVYAGEAAAIKYPGLVYAVFPAVLWVVVLCLSSDRPRKWRSLACCSVGVILGVGVTCLPWYAKNVVLTGNPVYPLAQSVFGGRNLDAKRAKQWSEAHRVPVSSPSASPYSPTAAIESAKQVFVKSEFLQPVLPIFMLCGLIGWWSASRPGSVRRADSTRSSAETSKWIGNFPWVPIWLAISLWIFAVWWLTTHRIDRFWLPVVSLWCVLAGLGVAWTAQRVSHTLATVLVLFGLAYGCIVNSSPALGDNRYLVTLDALRQDVGDEESVGRISRATGWCNRNLAGAPAKLLMIGEARAFDFRLPVVYSTCFDTSPAETWLRGVPTAGQRQRLEENHVTHILVNWSELARYRSEGNYGFSDWPTQNDFQAFVESGLLMRVADELDPAITEIFEVVGVRQADEK